MTENTPLEDLVQQGRPRPSVPARLGRHDVLIEAGPFGTFVYQIRGGRVLVVHSNKGYREDVAAALLDAVDDIADGDLGSIVRLRPIGVAGFPLDRAALLGPGRTDFFRNTPLAERGMQVIPVHRAEAVDGEEYESFWPGVIGKNLSIRHYDWTRGPTPRADVRRLDAEVGGPYRHTRNSRRSSKPALVTARSVLERTLPTLADDVRLSIMEVRGHELRLRREWDRLRGTLHLPGTGEVVDVDVARASAWAVFGPLFGGEDVDPAALSAVTTGPPEDLLEIQVNDEQRRRYDGVGRPATLAECLAWLRALAPVDGNFLVIAGRSGGVVQVRWQAPPESAEPPQTRLWLETPDPTLRRSRGRYVTLDEAEEMITTLARTDRVAVDGLGNLEDRPW